MTGLASRIANLPPEKRAMLEERLLREASSRKAARSIPRRGLSHTPLSFAQQRLWFLDQLDPASSLYNVPEALALRGPLDVAALERSLQIVVDRHEILRTSFGGENGEARARVEPIRIRLSVSDLEELPEARRLEEAKAIASAEAEAPFDLRQAPLIRGHLLRLAPEEHWLLLTMHHIVSDEWSMGVLYKELSELYAAARSGREHDLRPLPIQYGDYALWQREWLSGGVKDRLLSYWKGKLAGDLPTLALPLDRARPPVQRFRGAECRRRIHGRPAMEALEALCKSEGATPFMTLLAAFFVLLSRYAGQQDILVGTPIAGRNRLETEGLIGFFVNTLVLRGDLSADPTFRQFLGTVRETALEAYTNQELPFEALVEELRPERSRAHSPLFQAMFELDEGTGSRLELAGLEVEPIELPDMSAKFDLSLLVVTEEDGLELVFEYATDLFDASTIARLAVNYETLMLAALALPDRPVSRLPILSEAERRQVLVHWNRTGADYPREKCVHRLFQEQAARTPEAVAVALGENALTYAELDRRSSQLAEHLQELGVRPDTLVGLCVPRSLDMIVGVLGILKAGGAYVPLDPTYPAQRLAYMLSDSGVELLVTLESAGDALPPYSGRLVRLDGDGGAIFGRPGNLRDSGVTPENLAYVMYTSGSTGQPKGVMVPHRGLVNYLSWCLAAYDVASGSGAPLPSSLSFDLTVTGLFCPLLCGRRVNLLEEGFATEALGSMLANEGGFSLVKITPARFDMLEGEIPPERAAGCTRAFVIGGEALRAESLSFWRDHAPRTAIFNEYGPTETVVGCSVYQVTPDDPRTGPVPIGRPIANTRIYVLDQHREPVPIGVTGELYVGGDGVARGYWKRPELTAERFVEDPFGGPGERLYRTGDLARYRPDGNLDFLGRSDGQVKIRGYRVELAEVEAAMREHPSVREAAVALRQEKPGEQRLVGYVVPGAGMTLSPEAVRRHLIDRLPAFMVPSVVVGLDRLPMTGNGKLDRRALPSPDWQRRETEEDYEPPRDALELQLVRIWEKVLQTGPIGLEDDFFELGGHSLLAVRLFAEIEKATGARLPLATLFQSPTVGQIADVLRQRGWFSAWSSLVPIQPRGDRPPLFCVHAVGGSVLPYRALSARLGRDQPFYGLQARGLHDPMSRPERVEEMAEHYLVEMRSLQPHGPYYLGGHSAGGLVAYEMARRLRDMGEEVALLALFDSWAPGHGELIPQKVLQMKLEQLRARLLRFFGRLREGGQFGYLAEKLRIRLHMLLDRTPSLPPDLQKLQDAIEDAVDEYRPAPCELKVTLFRAERQPPEHALDRTLGWGALALGGVEVHEVPGYHHEIVMEPEAAILAERLRWCLDRALREPRKESGARKDGS